jgi:RHS repeat-associated protein
VQSAETPLVAWARREGGEIIYYSYDFRSRLTGETWYTEAMSSIYAFEYAYDGAGNRTRKTRSGAHTYYEFDTVNRLLRSHDASADTWTYFEYDARGNNTMIQEPTGPTYFSYNDRDLMSSIRYPDGSWNYFHYDGQQRRYAIQDSGGLSYFTWDQNGMNLLCEKTAAGTVTAKYAHGYTPIDGIGSLVEAQKTTDGTVWQYPICDHRGTVVKMLDEDGDAVSGYEYNAWGEPLQAVDIGPVAANRFRYQSNWIVLPDSGGLIYISARRAYHAGIGRFFQRHPRFPSSAVLCVLGAAPRTDSPSERRDGINSYQYVAARPITFADPTGLWGNDVHERQTREWAEGQGMALWAAAVVGAADNAVDPPSWHWPFAGQALLSWHFDIPHDAFLDWGASDSRYVHAEEELQEATDICSRLGVTDEDVRAALRHLGAGLHAVQDWVAHGTWDPTWRYPLVNWREHPGDSDRWGFDFAHDLDGILRDYERDGGEKRSDPQFIAGTLRQNATGIRTLEYLDRFRNALARWIWGNCYCQIYRGG